MNSNHTELAPLHLKPSELIICRDPREISTVLGSCVAVTMFSPRLGLAAICHAMLPCPRQGQCPNFTVKEPYKYVNYAVPTMINAFRRHGSLPHEIETKVFGGGNLIGQNRHPECKHCVGPANVRMTWQLLQQEKIPIKVADVGGNRGRKIVFNTVTGGVRHKYLA